MIKIILLEDHPIVAYNIMSGLTVHDEIAYIHTIHSGTELMNYENIEEIDIVLLDINLPDADGFEICKYLTNSYPHIKVIGISSFENFEYISKLMNAGAKGYAVKGTKNIELFQGIMEVMKGNIYLCPIARKVYGNNEQYAAAEIKLSRLEKQLQSLLSEQKNINQISRILDIPEFDISIYIKMLHDKLNKFNISKDNPN